MSFVLVFRGRLQDVFKTSRSRGVYLPRLHIFRKYLQDVFKTFSRRLPDIFQTSCQDVFKTFLRHLVKTCSRNLQDVLPRRLDVVFETCSRRFAKMSSTHLQEVSKKTSRHLPNVFKMFHQIKMFLSAILQDVFQLFLRAFNTFLTRTAKTVIYRKTGLSHTSEKSMVR